MEPSIQVELLIKYLIVRLSLPTFDMHLGKDIGTLQQNLMFSR